MKKLLFVLALGAFAACGSGETKTPAVDSMKMSDSLKAAATADSTKAAAMDTTKKDTTKPKM